MLGSGKACLESSLFFRLNYPDCFTPLVFRTNTQSGSQKKINRPEGWKCSGPKEDSKEKHPETGTERCLFKLVNSPATGGPFPFLSICHNMSHALPHRSHALPHTPSLFVPTPQYESFVAKYPFIFSLSFLSLFPFWVGFFFTPGGKNQKGGNKTSFSCCVLR